MGKKTMIERYISEAALQMELEVSDVTLVDGMSLGCTDIDLVNISTRGREVGALVFQSDLGLLAQGVVCDRLEFGVRFALSRLQKLSLESGVFR